MRAHGALRAALGMALVAAAALTLAAPVLPAVAPGTTAGRMGLAAQEQPQLLASARSLAHAWAGGADQIVVSRLADVQVSLHLEGTVAATLPTRQASAALRGYLRNHQPGEVEIARVALVEGSSDRGFAELRWTTRRAGTSQSLERTVFLGFRHDGRSWTVDEVRVFP